MRGSVREEYLFALNYIKQNYSKLLSLLKKRFGVGEGLSSVVQLEGEDLFAQMRLHSRMESSPPTTEVKTAPVELQNCIYSQPSYNVRKTLAERNKGSSFTYFFRYSKFEIMINTFKLTFVAIFSGNL